MNILKELKKNKITPSKTFRLFINVKLECRNLPELSNQMQHLQPIL